MGERLCCVELPFPPSVNTYWRTTQVHGQQRTLISKRGRDYQAAFKQNWYVARPRTWIQVRDPVKVKLSLYPPDKRQRDLDNYFKALFDCCTKSGVWSDDSLVHEIHARWGMTGEHGACVIMTIEEMT